MGTMEIAVQGISIKRCIATGASKAAGGTVDIMSDDDMKIWGLDPDVMKDSVRQVQEQAEDRVWEVIADLFGQDSRVNGTIFDPNAGVPKLSRLGKV